MAVEILEVCRVSPPGDPAPAAMSLPLTFFDIYWLPFPYATQRLFLYHLPGCSDAAFLRSHLPALRRSLSLALARFLPLAGRLVADTHLRYVDGDFVPLTVARCDDDLRELASHQPKSADRLHPLVPPLPPGSGNVRPVLALQATVFPDQGIAVGVTAHHAVVDGSSFLHFARTWAAICRSADDVEDPPLLDRAVIPDSGSRRETVLAAPERFAEMGRMAHIAGQRMDLVRATFALTAAELERLRSWVSSRARDGRRFSAFTLTVALVWTCLLESGHQPPSETEALAVSIDCRRRLDPPVPAAYFGNCVGGFFVEAERRRLEGKEGVVVAAEAIRESLGALDAGGGGLLGRLGKMMQTRRRIIPGRAVSIAGSPRFGVYRVDFGWGRPSKCEVVSIDGTGSFSLAENDDDGEGGVEIGLALPPHVMENFARHFELSRRLN